MLIAVDFDGTIVEHKYPQIGKEIPFAIVTLKKLQDDGHRLILWSCREGRLLQEAVEWCRQRGLEFFAVNSNYPDEDVDEGAVRSRKLKADMFIDDRNVGGLPDWGVLYEMISRGMSYDRYLREASNIAINQPKRSLWEKIFG
ncbi:MAG: hypothetical protein IKY82_08445 [Alistipes sp.]|nr:hypothetical protein [Alistipes sp.]